MQISDIALSSYAQQRLWFLDQYQSVPGLYNIPGAWRLLGKVDESALARSLNEVLRRHEALRTRFEMAGGELMQVIEAPLPLELALTQGSGQGQAWVSQWVEEQSSQTFDLGKGPLIRAGLLKLGDEEHILQLTMHHVVSDGWSMGVLMKELGALYAAFSLDRPSPLAELPIQYADYAVWQRQWLQEGALQTQLAYWRKTLQGAPARLELPTDRPRPAVLTHRGAVLAFELNASLSAQLKELGRAQQVTPFILFAAVFNVLLSRYSGQDDISMGYPVANRTRQEVEGLIGFFVNTLVLRTKLDEQESFEELLKRVREAVLDADAHQDLPFEKLVEELNPQRSQDHTPLFQVMLTMGNAMQGEGLSLPGLQVSSHYGAGGQGTSKFELTLSVTEQEGRFCTALEYNTDLFEHERIERMAGHLQVLLEAVVVNPGAKVRELPLLTERERHQILVEWSGTDVAYTQDKCAHELFEEQVERSPGAIAVIFEDQEVSYGELNERANRLAHHLIELGVKPDDLVGLCVERSVEMVVGLLGILKAGGAYVPIDANYPSDRLKYMLEDTHAQVLVTQQCLCSRFQSFSNFHVVILEDAIQHTEGCEISNPNAQIFPEHLAYCIYTSGSTGKPKGVLVSSGALAQHIAICIERYKIQARDRILQFASLNFDPCLEQIFVALGSGSALVLRGGEQWTTDELINVLAVQGVTVANLPTAYWRLLSPVQLEALDRETSLRLIVVGGDVARVCSYATGIELLNAYGPTEAVITSTVGSLRPVGASKNEHASIGWPLKGRQLLILDACQNIVPEGVIGEIFISGKCLARGYLNRADLTAEKFLPNKYGESGSRMYRTGDLGCWKPDGSIEFFGRQDHQVKIRGFRIELKEIENALLHELEVKDAVIAVREDESGEKSLVCYVVGYEEQSISVDVLKAKLSQRLPEYMVPTEWMEISTLPLNSNGKVDRQKLPIPFGKNSAAQGHVAPQTATEELLAGIWSEVLKVEQIGLHDNFFALGGHSLKAAQVAGRIKDSCKAAVTIKDLFQYPTVGRLSEHVMRMQGQMVGISPLKRGRLTTTLSSYAQQRLWFLDQYESVPGLYNIPGAWRLLGKVDESALARSLNEVLRRHEALRTRFEMAGGELMQVIEAPLPLELALTQGSGQGQAWVSQWVEEQSSQTFDLGKGPLIRAGLLKLGDEEHILQLTMHHVVSDGWSMGVLMKELGALYAAFSLDRPSPLAELPIQYADYAVWQRQWLQEGALQTQLAYWRKTLQGAPARLELPTDRPRPAVLTHRGAVLAFELNASLSAQLKELGRAQQVTPFILFAAVFNVLLSRYSGQDDISMGYPVANRTRQEVEGLIGFFVNTLVLRTKLDEQESFEELLKRVREAVLDADAHQDLPFEKLVEELNPQRSQDHTPLFQVMLTMGNAMQGEGLSLPGLQVSSHYGAGGQGTSKFELTLSVTEQEGRFCTALEYNTDLFEHERIERMAGHLQVLLEAVVVNPGAKVRELPLLTERERHQILVEWSGTDVAYTQDKCAHELFEEQVERSPGAIAVIFEDQEVSYGELNERANRLAHHLIELGVKPDDLVGLCVERSVEMVVGLLGTLKAGGAYLPIDPGYPAERIAYMLEDAAPAVVLIQSDLKAQVSGTVAKVVELDGQWQAIARHPSTKPNAGLIGHTPDHLAYVIYTSGSTGQPKGAMNEHRALVDRLYWMRQTYGLSAQDRVLQKTPFGFDVSVWEFFWPLISGARLVVARPQGHQDPAYLGELIKTAGITALHFVPSMLQVFLEQDQGQHCSSVRHLVCSGEELSWSLRQRCLESLPHSQLHNLYGPAEAAIHVSSWTCHSDETGGRVPIGHPIANARLYVLSEQGCPVPAGVAGEIHIGGVGVARGYLNRAGLTAERFVKDPFSEAPQARMYKTGDVGRWKADGSLEYLGRNDHQVKLRGLRIELGEIEAQLLQHTWVKEAVVVAREDEPGNKRLIAYLTAHMDESKRGAVPTLNIEALRTYLKAKLPGYMVPTGWVMLEQLPLNANGKVDRNQLPAPQWRVRLDYVAPRTAKEKLLASVWSEVLKVAQVGIHDNFFEIGGHSLLAIQLVHAIRGATGKRVTVKLIFENPTIKELAKVIDKLTAMRLQPISSDEIFTDGQEFEATAGQNRLLIMDTDGDLTRESDPSWNISIAIEINNENNRDAVEACLKEILRRHKSLRTSFFWDADRLMQRIHEVEDVPLEFEFIDGSPGSAKKTIQDALMEDASVGFYLGRHPPVRIKIYALVGGQMVVSMTVHHVNIDGISSEIIYADFQDIYERSVRGKSVLSDEYERGKEAHFHDFSSWQNQLIEAGGEEYEALLKYWLRRFDSDYQRLRLSFYPDDLNVPYKGAVKSISMPDGFVAKINNPKDSYYITPFVLTIAAFFILIIRHSERPDVTVSIPVAGRTQSRWQRVVGYFSDTQLIRINEQEINTMLYSDFLEMVRTECVGALDHQDMPHSHLMSLLQKERGYRYIAPFNLRFAYQNYERTQIGNEQGRLRRLDFSAGHGGSTRDMALYIAETDGGGLNIGLQYNENIISSSWAARICEEYVQLLWKMTSLRKKDETIGCYVTQR